MTKNHPWLLNVKTIHVISQMWNIKLYEDFENHPESQQVYQWTPLAVVKHNSNHHIVFPLSIFIFIYLIFTERILFGLVWFLLSLILIAISIWICRFESRWPRWGSSQAPLTYSHLLLIWIWNLYSSLTLVILTHANTQALVVVKNIR